MADSRVTIVLDAQGSEAVAKVFNDLAAKGKDFANSINRGAKDTAGALDSLSSAGKRVFEIFTGVSLGNIFVQATQQIKDLTIEMVKLGREARVQEESFRLVAESVGVSADAMDEGLKRAADGLANTSDTLLSSARALQQGLQPEQIVSLMEIARQQAKLAGKDVTTAFNDIATATTNQQLRALKAYGIIIDLNKTYEEHAQRLGVVASALTEAGQSQAIAIKVIEEMRGKLVTSSTEILRQEEAVKRWQVAWEEGKEAVGKRMAEITFIVIDGAKRMKQALIDNSWLKAATDNLNSFAAKWEKFRDSLLTKVGIDPGVGRITPEMGGGGPNPAAMNESALATGKAAEQVDRLKAAMGQAEQQSALFTASIAANRATSEAFAASLQISIDALIAAGAAADPQARLKVEQLRGALLALQHTDFAQGLEAQMTAVKNVMTLQTNAVSEAVANREISEREGATKRVEIERQAAADQLKVYTDAQKNFVGTEDQRLALEKQANQARLALNTAATQERINAAKQETEDLKAEYDRRLAAFQAMLSQQQTLQQQAQTAQTAIVQSQQQAQLAFIDRQQSAELSALKIRQDKGLESEKQVIQKRLEIETNAAQRRYDVQAAAAEREYAIAVQAADQRLNATADSLDRQKALLDEQLAENTITENDYRKAVEALDFKMRDALIANAGDVQQAQIAGAAATQTAWEQATSSIQQSTQNAAEATVAQLAKVKAAGSGLLKDMVDNAGKVIQVIGKTGDLIAHTSVGMHIGAGALGMGPGAPPTQEQIAKQKELADAAKAFWDAYQKGQISFTDWQMSAGKSAEELNAILSHLPEILDEAAAKEVLLGSAAKVAQAAMDAQARAVAAQKAAAVSPAEILAAAQAEADLEVKRAKFAADRLVTERAIVQATLEGAAAAQYAADTATLVSYEIKAGADAAAAALVAGAKAAIEAYQSVRDTAIKLNTQIAGDLLKMQTDAAQAIKDQLTHLTANVAYAQQQLDIAIAAKASAADQLELEQNLRDAIMARYDAEVEAIKNLEQQIKDQLGDAATPLVELQTTIADLTLSADGSIAPFVALEKQLLSVADATTQTTIKLWALSQGINAVVASAEAAVNAAVKGKGPLAITPTETGPGVDVTQVLPFVQGLYDAAAPFISKLGTLASEAINSGDIQGAISLLQQQQAAVQALAKAAIDAVNDWADAAIEAVQTFAKEQIASVTALAKTQTDPLQKQLDAQKDLIKETEKQAKAQIEANDVRIKGLNKEIDAIQKSADAQNKVYQRQIDGLNKQIDGIQKVADAQVKANDVQLKGLNAQVDAIQKAADAQVRANEKQISTLDKQVESIERAAAAQIKLNDAQLKSLGDQVDAINKVAEAARRANQTQIDALSKQVSSIQKVADAQIKANDTQSDALSKQIQAINAVAEAQQEANQKRIDALDIEKDSLETAIRAAEDWQHALDSVQKQIHDLMLGPEAPLNPMAQLQIARDAFQQALGDTGTPEGVAKAQQAIADYLKAAQGVYARPSTQYQDIFGEAMAALRGLETTATQQRGPASLDDLNAQLDTLNAQIESLNATNKEIAANAKEQIAPLQAQVDALKELNETIKAQADADTGPLKEQIDALKDLNDSIKADAEARTLPLQEQIDALKDLNDAIKADADARTGPLKDQIQALQDLNATIKENTDEQLQPLKDQIQNLQDLNTSIKDLADAQIEPLKAQVETLTQAQSDLKDATDALLQPLQDDVDALKDLNDSIQAQADEITGPLAASNENLATQIEAINTSRDAQIEAVNQATKDQIEIINSVRDAQIDAINEGLGTTLSNIETTMAPLVQQLIDASVAQTGGIDTQEALKTATINATTALTTLNASVVALIAAMDAAPPPGAPAQPPPVTTDVYGNPVAPTTTGEAPPLPTTPPPPPPPAPPHGTITPSTFITGPPTPFPHFQRGGIMPFTGAAHLEEKEMVLPERIATYVVQAMARPAQTGAASVQLSIAPGAITISGVSDPEAAAQLALDKVEESVRTGRLNAIILDKVR